MRRTHLYRVLVLGAVLLAFVLRLPEPANPWPGLYHDEAYNGLDAVSVLDGELRLYFPANNGREPLFIYLVSGFVAALGRTPAAVRLPAAFVGTLGVAAAFAFGAALFGRRHGMLAAWLMAVTPWPVILGRVGFRAGTLALLLPLAAAATVRGIRTCRADRRRAAAAWLALGGGLSGLSLYTYTAARVAPLLLLAMAGWALATGWRAPGWSTGGRRMSAVWLVAALVVAMPLFVVFAADPAGTLGRLSQVSVVSRSPAAGDVPEQLAVNARATIGLLTSRGDFIPRHNIPERPVFGFAAGLLAVVGVVYSITRARGSPAHALAVSWLIVMALPTLLAEDPPHFLRAAGLLPMLVLLPGLGIEALGGLSGRLRRSFPWPATTACVVVSVLVVVGELAAIRAYDDKLAAISGSSIPMPRLPAEVGTDALATDVFYAFETGAAALASLVNRNTERGWVGGWGVPAQAVTNPTPSSSSSAEPPSGSSADTRTPGSLGQWLDRRLRDGWAAVPYLVPEHEALVVDPYDPILTTGLGSAWLLPHGLNQEGLWSRLPPYTSLEFRPGGCERGDLDEDPQRLWVTVLGSPAYPRPPAFRFANGLVVYDSSLEADEHPWCTTSRPARLLHVVSRWGVAARQVEEPTAFFQVLDGDRIVAQSDRPLGSDLFSVTRWRPGDQVIERRTLDLPECYDRERHRIIFGLYTDSASDRVPVVDASGAALSDHVVVSEPAGTDAR